MHWPGIEPGPPAWQASILPLNHQCFFLITKEKYVSEVDTHLKCSLIFACSTLYQSDTRTGLHRSCWHSRCTNTPSSQHSPRLFHCFRRVWRVDSGYSSHALFCWFFWYCYRCCRSWRPCRSTRPSVRCWSVDRPWSACYRWWESRCGPLSSRWTCGHSRPCMASESACSERSLGLCSSCRISSSRDRCSGAQLALAVAYASRSYLESSSSTPCPPLLRNCRPMPALGHKPLKILSKNVSDRAFLSVCIFSIISISRTDLTNFGGSLLWCLQFLQLETSLSSLHASIRWLQNKRASFTLVYSISKYYNKKKLNAYLIWKIRSRDAIGDQFSTLWPIYCNLIIYQFE